MQSSQAGTRISWVYALMALVGLVASLGSACEHQLTIRQGDQVNNAMHRKRPKAARTGEPLELTLVLVLPKARETPANEALRPPSEGEAVTITCKDWYERRPGGPSATPFAIPPGHIFVLTDQSAPADGHGIKVNGGALLHGSKFDDDLTVILGEDYIMIGGQKTQTERWDKPWDFSLSPLGSKECCLYAFGRFTNEAGDVLPVKAAMRRPKDMKGKSTVIRVGVDAALYENDPVQAQYIRLEQ
jgi:hypothetical protein